MPVADGSGAQETLTHALDRLRESGYDHDFVAVRSGLRDRATGEVFPPEAFCVDEVVRFEGATDPGDEAIVFALRDTTGSLRGTYSAGYGANIEPADAEMLQRLPLHG